jgi:hypothetical protein
MTYRKNFHTLAQQVFLMLLKIIMYRASGAHYLLYSCLLDIKNGENSEQFRKLSWKVQGKARAQSEFSSKIPLLSSRRRSLNFSGFFFYSEFSQQWICCQVRAQTSHNIDCVLGSLCYIKPCSIGIAWQRSSPMKGEMRWRGPNSISKVHLHNINAGAVDDTWRHR